MMEQNLIDSFPKFWLGKSFAINSDKLLKARTDIDMKSTYVIEVMRKMGFIKFSLSTLYRYEIGKSKNKKTRSTVIYALSLIYNVNPTDLVVFASKYRNQEYRKQEKITPVLTSFDQMAYDTKAEDSYNRRLDIKKAHIKAVTLKASVLNRSDFAKISTGHDQEFFRKVYNMVEDKMIRNAMEEYL